MLSIAEPFIFYLVVIGFLPHINSENRPNAYVLFLFISSEEFFFTRHKAENKATVATVRNLIEKNFGIYLDCIG